ncbi:transcriptional regulator, TetR family [Pseudoramibacter alactolyticus ATCC 23263]|uniref:Transcriptional regulator, TetR family n=1 Tax=Pseudoramibacter alactolyticus ATCC 23263 TaxID=887929 RepID=E6MJK5_9FIRM|nr:TetR-like C-terminal domain-containing protein [Pseudoramibacter alactolyticus]EFV00741.1 transcriptional regulator, TetR family [Pseudoramibacter alactolyticus ATCC 23263]
MEKEKKGRREDRRVRKTKAALRKALTDFLREKPIQEIRVREIADKIDINRGTFYQYYRDVYDMLAQLEAELFEQFNVIFKAHRDPVMTNEDIKAVFVQIFTLLAVNADLAIVLMGPNGDPVFVDKIRQMVRRRCIDDFFRNYQKNPDETFEYFYAYAVSGCIGLFQRWLSGGARETPEQMADIVEEILLKGIQVLEG